MFLNAIQIETVFIWNYKYAFTRPQVDHDRMAYVAGISRLWRWGSPSPAASGLKAIATESTVTISWDMVSGVEYWIFYAPTSVVPASTASMGGWIGLPGGVSMINVTSPYVASGLTNGVSYSFSVNGRTGGGPGGPGTTPVTATPMLAGSTWSLGSATDARELRSAMFGSSYVAAGASGAMYSSTDGATWSAINYTTSSNLNGASYFGTYKLVGMRAWYWSAVMP